MQDPNQSWRVRIAYGAKWRVRSIMCTMGAWFRGWVEGVGWGGGFRGWVERVGSGGGFRGWGWVGGLGEIYVCV